MSDAAAASHPIAITGMHRSGTSMITRGLHESGLHLIGGSADALLEAADDNPEGFWENKAIVACNDDLLEAAGGSWDNPPKLLPMAVDDPRLAEVVEPATAALAGLAENERWGFKDPRLCLTAAFWLDLQPDLRFVICVRNPLEVALSLKRRNQNSYSLGLALWERYYQSVLELVPADRRVVTHYDTYFLDPAGELRRICDFAGLDAAELDVRADLRHHDVGVSLDEANLGSGLRELYARLCEEAGAPVPRPTATDEGQVRRLVLDGTVAARHAEQRQQAIERLEERLAESRAAEKEAREELARVRRESETRRAELAAVTRELDHFRADIGSSLQRLETQNQRSIDTTGNLGDVVHRLDERQQAMYERTTHIGDILDAVHVKLRAVEETVRHNNVVLHQGPIRRMIGGLVRRLRGQGVPVAKKTAKATASHLPQPIRHNVHRVRRAVADGQAGNRVRERAVRVVDQLPGPARKAARKGRTALRRSGAVPRATRVARSAARRMPTPVKRLARSATVGGGLTAPAAPAKASPAPRPEQRDAGRNAQVPKGPASFKWQKGYERLVAEFVGPETSWAVVTPGCKANVAQVAGRTAIAFPSPDGEAPAADSVSLVAILEALRLRGAELLVLPEGARAWFQGHPELRDHLGRSHRVLADRPAAGVVFDLAVAPTQRPGLLATVKDLSRGRPSPPAVLDWSGLDVAGDLPGFTTFAPAIDDGRAALPYFDDSVAIVVTATTRDRSEAMRVATAAVVVCERVGADLRVVDVHRVGDAARAAEGVTVVATSSTPEIDAAVRTRVEAFGAELRFDAVPDAGAVAAAGDVVIVVEEGTVPLPGALDAMTTAVRRCPERVSVAKVLDDHGRIESAGGMVFADGSVVGIAEGTLDVRAPWHEFNRPTCWGGGLVAASAAVWSALPAFDPDDPVGWFGRVWESGRSVDYRSGATVVRVGPTPRRPAASGGVWDTRLTSRPNRPADLGDGSWRYFLANDDVGALLAEGGI